MIIQLQSDKNRHSNRNNERTYFTDRWIIGERGGNNLLSNRLSVGGPFSLFFCTRTKVIPFLRSLLIFQVFPTRLIVQKQKKKTVIETENLYMCWDYSKVVTFICLNLQVKVEPLLGFVREGWQSSTASCSHESFFPGTFIRNLEGKFVCLC